jgi:ferredoxin
MAADQLPVGSFVRFAKPQLQAVIGALHDRGYRTIGPKVADGAIVYAELDGADQLPVGYVDHQDGGTYRLERSGTGHFDYVVGPESLKKYMFPPRETLLESIRRNGSWQMTVPDQQPEPLAVIGVRSCDLHALAVQDKVFLGGPFVDPGYRARREKLFLVAVNCRRAAPTCFCHSMNTGPAVGGGFDLALTELEEYFVVEIGTKRGGDVIAATAWAPCTPQEIDEARAVPKKLEQSMRSRPSYGQADSGRQAPRQRTLDTTGIRDLLLENLDHPRWQEVAERCLSCANCTMVCPTCFCASVEDVSDLTGDNVRRERAWDSCFTAEHSTMSTGTVRKTTASRYRQWMTHKLATWIDQFGESGCVGCGRCITWCPVGIDLTEEVAAIRGELP